MFAESHLIITVSFNRMGGKSSKKKLKESKVIEKQDERKVANGWSQLSRKQNCFRQGSNLLQLT